MGEEEVAFLRVYGRLYRDLPESPESSEIPTVDKRTVMENLDDVITDRRVKRAEVEEFLSQERKELFRGEVSRAGNGRKHWRKGNIPVFPK